MLEAFMSQPKNTRRKSTRQDNSNTSRVAWSEVTLQSPNPRRFIAEKCPEERHGDQNVGIAQKENQPPLELFAFSTRSLQLCCKSKFDIGRPDSWDR